MPSKPPRLLACGCIMPAGQQCQHQIAHEAKRRAAYDRQRGPASRRGYDAAWQNTRKAKLAMNPICEHSGCNRSAVDVHHELSVRTHPHLRLVMSNLTALCKSHHSSITAKTQGFARQQR